MRIPRSRAHRTLRTVIRKRSSSYDLTRPTITSTGRFGESADEKTTTIPNVSMWLHEPNEINVDVDGGDRIDGDLNGLALPSADVEVNDIVSHGVDTYEVQRIMHLPDNDNQQIKLFALQRRTND